MNSFIFSFSDKGSSYTAIFCCCKDIVEEDLTAEIKSFHSNQQRSNFVVIIYPNGILSEVMLKKIVNSSAHVDDEQIILLPYSENGLIEESDFSATLMYHGNLTIVHRNNIILHSDNNFHYVNPSLTHSPYFIRTANMLSRNEEINFVALQLLKFINEESLTEIVSDTSSILTIPYALIYMRSLFGKLLEVPIRSFKSYAFKEYRFKRGSLVLISASNSGRLEDGIRKFEPDLEIVTLIFNSQNVEREIGTTRKIVFNVAAVFHELLPKDHQLQQFGSENCDYCNDNSIPVLVRDDHFMPSRVLIQSVIIKKHHNNTPSFGTAIKYLTACNSIAVYKGEGAGSGKIRDVYFDLPPLIESNGLFKNELDKFLNNCLPASTNLVIYLEDISSKHLANEVDKFLKSLGGPSPEVVSFKDVSKLENIGRYKTLLVVASCISTGNILNGVAQSLRRFKHSSIFYLVGIGRLHDLDKLKTLRSNLESRQGTTQINKLFILAECFLPNNHSQLTTRFLKPSFGWERELLSSWIQKYPTSSQIIQSRVQTINRLAGMSTNVFFPDPFLKKELSLRPNFAFFDFPELNKVSQADVYFIMYMVIHCLRHPKLISGRKDDDKFLIQHEHVKSLIDANNFTRYNDGVIQASILRIARPVELDFTIDVARSEELLRNLIILFNPNNLESAEGILEFLFAIASEKLKLHRPHLLELIAHLSKEFTSVDEVQFFVKVIEGEIINLS